MHPAGSVGPDPGCRGAGGRGERRGGSRSGGRSPGRPHGSGASAARVTGVPSAVAAGLGPGGHSARPGPCWGLLRGGADAPAQDFKCRCWSRSGSPSQGWPRLGQTHRDWLTHRKAASDQPGRCGGPGRPRCSGIVPRRGMAGPPKAHWCRSPTPAVPPSRPGRTSGRPNRASPAACPRGPPLLTLSPLALTCQTAIPLEPRFPGTGSGRSFGLSPARRCVFRRAGFARARRGRGQQLRH